MAVVLQSSIGPGQTFSTIVAWETAKPADLVAIDSIWKGLVYESVTYGAVTIAGSTTDATRYAWLIAAPGHQYNPKGGHGARILQTADATALTISEVGTRVEGIAIQRTTGTGNVVDINATNVVMGCCVAICTAAAVTGAMVGFFRQAGAPTLHNCIAIGGGVNDQGMSIGFDGNAGTMTCLACIAWNVKGLLAGNALGFEDVTATNCISFGSKTTDYGAGVIATSASTDATGAPAGLQALTAATVLESPTVFDFRPRKGQALINAGTATTLKFDFVGQPVDATPDVGAYQLVQVPVQGRAYDEGISLGRGNPWHRRVGIKTRI